MAASRSPTRTRSAPLIDPAYLSAESDVRALVRGLRFAERLFETDALRPIAGEPLPPWPGKVADEVLIETIRRHAQTLFHPIGTCRLGQADDDEAVVEATRSRVEISRLRCTSSELLATSQPQRGENRGKETVCHWHRRRCRRAGRRMRGGVRVGQRETGCASQAAPARPITAACTLLPAQAVSDAVGIPGRRPKEEEKVGSTSSCAYLRTDGRPTGLSVAVSTEKSSASPEEAVRAIALSKPAEPVDGLGDAAAFLPSSAVAQLVVVKKADGELRALIITSLPDLRDKLTALARQAVGKF